MPGRQACELCPQLIFVGGHFREYQRLGDAAIKVIGDFTPLVERISIDEAFADVAGCTHLFGPPAEIATAIRRGRLVLGVSGEQWLADLHTLPELHFEPISAGIAELAGSFDDTTPGDPADRIIAATAIALESRLVTADRRLRRTPRLEAVW